MKLIFNNGTELKYLNCLNTGAQFFKENMRESREFYIPCSEISFDNLHGLISEPLNIETIILVGETYQKYNPDYVAVIEAKTFNEELMSRCLEQGISEEKAIPFLKEVPDIPEYNTITPTNTLLNFMHGGYISMCNESGVECWKFRLYEKSPAEMVIDELLSIAEV